MDNEELLRQEAVRQLRKRRDFWGHVVAYVVVNAFLIGLALNAWEVYGRRGITEAQIRQEMDRQRTSGRVCDDKVKD